MATFTEMPKYEAYKNSEVEWLGKIPEHWRVIRLKNVAFINPVSDISSCDLDEAVCFLPMEKVGTDGAVEYDQYRTLRSVKQGFTSFQNNDVIIAKITPCFENGKGAHLKNMPTKFGYGSTEFHVLRAYKNYNPAFLFYLTKSHLFMDLGEQLMTGSAGQKRVPTSFISDFLFASPSEDEQTAIANFLDEKNAKIDEAIAIKEQQIELLKERKQIIIQQAVTQGLDPTVPMKDSGVEWIGQIPAHWSCAKLKLVCHFIFDGTHGSYPRVDTGYRLLSVRNIVNNEFVFRDDDSNVSYKHFKEISSKFKVMEGDIQLAIVGATLGKVAVVKRLEEDVVTQRSLATIRVKSELINNSFVANFLRSKNYENFLWSNTSFSAQPGVYLNTIQNSYIPLAPKSEQDLIDKYIDDTVNKLNGVIENTQITINKLREYKTTLINSAVTGKIKVV